MAEQVLPIVMEVPDHREPIEMVREWAHRLRDFGGRAGEHYATPSPLDGLIALRVFVPRAREEYLRALYVLVRVNVWCLRAANNKRLPHAPFPPIYSSVCYQREPAGQEVWQSTESLHRRGLGDCEDLACALSAERLMVGTPCRPVLKAQPRPNGTVLYHVVVRLADGSIEDPSARLGMRLGRRGDVTASRCARVLERLESGEDRFAR